MTFLRRPEDVLKTSVSTGRGVDGSAKSIANNTYNLLLNRYDYVLVIIVLT